MNVVPPIFQSFLDYLKFEKRFSQHTIISYQTDLISFFDYLVAQYGEIALEDISHIYIRSWLASLKEVEISSKSINRKISTLRSFFKYQVKRSLLEQTPMTKIIAPKAEKRLPHFVSEKDMGVLFDHVEFGEDWKGKTDRLLMSIFYNTGMRLSEVVNLKESQVNISSNTFKVLGKGNKERIIPVSNELLSTLKDYFQEKRLRDFTSEFILVTDKGKPLTLRNVYTVVNKYLSLVTTIEKRSPHVMRHTFATHLLNGGADLNAVKELLGHSSLAATQVYTHNTIEKLKNIHQKAHPKA